MIQHPVVEGFEPDADILSIHIARVPYSARHARILFQRPVRSRNFGLDVRDSQNEIGPHDLAFGRNRMGLPT